MVSSSRCVLDSKSQLLGFQRFLWTGRCYIDNLKSAMLITYSMEISNSMDQSFFLEIQLLNIYWNIAVYCLNVHRHIHTYTYRLCVCIYVYTHSYPTGQVLYCPFLSEKYLIMILQLATIEEPEYLCCNYLKIKTTLEKSTLWKLIMLITKRLERWLKKVISYISLVWHTIKKLWNILKYWLPVVLLLRAELGAAFLSPYFMTHYLM